MIYFNKATFKKDKQIYVNRVHNVKQFKNKIKAFSVRGLYLKKTSGD